MRARVLLAGVAALSLAACASAPALPPPQDGLPAGVTHEEWVVEAPVRQVVQVARVDLSRPGVRIVVTAGEPEGGKEHRSATTSTWLRRTGAVLAINGGFFAPVTGEEGVPQDAVGLSRHAGVTISPPIEAGASRVVKAVVCAEGARMAILDANDCPADFPEGLAAGPLLRAAGRTRQDLEANSRHPRSALGISADGRTAVFMTVDGRQPGYSEGATFPELAALMERAGAADAINLDGGGSTALAVATRRGATRLLNRPIHAGQPGRERPAATHVGVFFGPAKPTP